MNKRQAVLIFFLSFLAAGLQAQSCSVTWGDTIRIAPRQGRYGSQYGRMLRLARHSWLAAYTVAENKGYRQNPEGGLSLEISRSDDGGQHWTPTGAIRVPGRDLDNAMLLRLPDLSVLLACRSVRWQESYRLLVYRSADEGNTWKSLSVIDANEGKPGSLGHPDKGVYEPHLYLLKDGRLAVMYANEKHVTDPVSYSQVISEKISSDQGRTWGHEILVAFTPGDHASRPGMPVWTELNGGGYLVVYEVCGPEACNIYEKKSADGVHWPVGIGKPIPDQTGAPFVLALNGGGLMVTSNRGNISVSGDEGANWLESSRPWSPPRTYGEDWTQTIWSALYQISPDSIGILSSVKQPDGSHEVDIRFGKLERSLSYGP